LCFFNYKKAKNLFFYDPLKNKANKAINKKNDRLVKEQKQKEKAQKKHNKK
jgi:hypothetical protein